MRRSPSARTPQTALSILLSWLVLASPLAPLPAAWARPARRGPATAATNRGVAPDAAAALPGPAPAPLAFLPSITATKADSFTDVGADGKADPGQTITYTVTITNNGTTSATGVTFTDSVDMNTSLVAGSVSTQPVAFNDTYTAMGNVRIQHAAAAGLIANDRDPDVGNGTSSGLTVTALAGDNTAPFAGTSSQGGNVTSSATDGGFAYNPAPGFTGNDTFTYTVTDAQGKTDTATVQVTVGPTLVWFINNDPGAPAGNDGRLTSPFNSVAAYNASAPTKDANDIVFIYQGTSAYTGNLTLTAGMKLIGQGFALQTETGAPPTGSDSLPAAAAAPTINNPGANIITLGQNNTLRGFNTGNSGAAGTDISGTGFGTLTVSALTVGGDGRALNLTTGTLAATIANISASNTGTNAGLVMNGVGGALTVSGSTTITNPGGTGLDRSNSPAGTNHNFGTTTVNKNSTGGVGVNLSANLGTTTFTALTVTTSNGVALNTNNAGTVNASGGSLTATGTGGAASLTNTVLGLTFTGVSSNGGANGLIISGGSGSFTSGSTTLQNNAGIGLMMASSAVAANFGNTSVTSSAGDAVDLNTNTGNITFADLDMTPDSGLRGLDAQNNTGTLTVTSGDITTLGGATAGAVFVDGPAGRTPINITLTGVTTTGVGNSINLVDVSGTKFQVTGTTQVNTRSTVNGGGAVFVDNSTATHIQLGTINIPNPNAAGGNGIHVEDSSSAVTVASATISDANQTVAQPDADNNGLPDSTVGDGNAIYLSANTGSFTLNGGTLSNCGNDCIDVRSSTNMALSNVTINGPGLDVSGAASSGTGGHGIQAINLTGTNSITNSTITNWETQARDGLRYWNNTGTSTLTIHGSTFSNSESGSNAILYQGDGTATMTLNVGGAAAGQPCTFSQVAGAAITHNAGGPTANTSPRADLNVINNTFTGTPNGGQNSVSSRNGSSGKAITVISGNTFDGVSKTLTDTSGVIDLGADATDANAVANGNFIHFTVTNNVIRNVGVAGPCLAPASPLDCDGKRGIDVFIDDNSVIGNGNGDPNDDEIVIENNVITNVRRMGIIFDTGSAFNGPNYAARITNNRVGIRVDNTIDRVGVGSDGLSGGGESGIRIENRNQNGKNLNVLLSNNLVYNGNGGAGSALNGSGVFVRAENTATLSATVTGNTVNTNNSSTSNALRADTNFSAGGTATLCLDASGNTLNALSGAADISLAEIQGILNVEQASIAALAAANPGSTASVLSGTPQFGVACATPPAAAIIVSPAGGRSTPTKKANNVPREGADALRMGGGVTHPPFVSPPQANRVRAATAAPARSLPELRSPSRADASRTSSGWRAPTAAPAVVGAALPGTGGTVTVNVGTLNPGDSVTITFQVVIDSPFTANPKQVSNQGTVSGSNFSNVLTDDPSVVGASDPTVTPVLVPPDVSVRDAKLVEPASGSANMVFTVVLSSPATGALTVNFATADEPAEPGKAVAGEDYTATSGSVVFAAGENLKTISVPVLSDAPAEPDETFLVNLTGATGAFTAIVDNQATGTITPNTPGAVLITELRTSGPGGAGDDFVEVYNNSDAPLTVSPTGWALAAANNGCAADPVVVGVIPNGTVIPARGHYLFVGSQYSLANYGGAGAAAGNLTLVADLAADANVALFSVADLMNLSSAAKLDGAGFGLNTGGVCDLLREGATLPTAAGSATQHSFVRKVTLVASDVPTPTDANDNAADFYPVSTTANVPISGAIGTPILGAPGPENRTNPSVKKFSQVGAHQLDPTKLASAVPNRVRKQCAAPSEECLSHRSSQGTISMRRRFVNNTGGPISRLRFRIYLTNTFQGPSVPVGTADLRAITSGPTSDSVTGVGTVTINGTTVEMYPTQQTSDLGGGWNSTFAVPSTVVSTGTPLANGASVYVQFLFGVQQGGSFSVLVHVEALP